MTGSGREEAHMYEITYLDASRVPVTRTAGANEVGALVAWAGRHGVTVHVRPYAGPGGGHVAGGAAAAGRPETRGSGRLPVSEARVNPH